MHNSLCRTDYLKTFDYRTNNFSFTITALNKNEVGGLHSSSNNFAVSKTIDPREICKSTDFLRTQKEDDSRRNKSMDVKFENGSSTFCMKHQRIKKSRCRKYRPKSAGSLEHTLSQDRNRNISLSSSTEKNEKCQPPAKVKSAVFQSNRQITSDLSHQPSGR